MSEKIVQAQSPKASIPRIRSGVPPDVQIMKKAILAQIADVAEEDLNVMEYNEILSFYNELMHACVEERTVQEANTDPGELRKDQMVNQQIDKIINAQTQAAQKSLGPGNENNQSCGKKQLSQNSHTENDSPQNEILVDGIAYYVPKTLSDSSYKLANNRFELICNPRLETIEEKRRAVIGSYSSAMGETIKLMKDQQIEQIYTRLCIHSLKQGQLNLRNLKYCDQIKLSQFCISLKKEELSSDITFYSQKNRVYSVRNPMRPNKINVNKEGTQHRNGIQLPNQYSEVGDEFFDEFYSNQNIPQQTITGKIEKKEPLKVQPTLRQTLKSLKQKQRTSCSVQTEKQKSSQVKMKSKITIISQTQYIQDNPQPTCYMEERPPRSQPLSQDEESQVPLPYKMNSSKFKKAILNPGAAPSSEVLEWIKNMKETINKLEYEYLNQFNNSWSVVSDQ